MLHKLLLVCSIVILAGCGEEEKESSIDFKSEAAPMVLNDVDVPTVRFARLDHS